MSRKAFFQALESVSDNTINKQWKPQTDNGIKSMTPFMAILGYKLHTNYEYTKKVYNMNKRYCNGIESQFYNDYTKLSNNVDISYSMSMYYLDYTEFLFLHAYTCQDASFYADGVGDRIDQ